ncbi:hypothetical protein P4493_09910 [Bacillus thuringiensis]|uniref:Uncharacterized protein n=3 Tax=Bacillus thuringiensis TaxID=1428 RepID=A0AB35PC32_BACTU|nr:MULTISPECIES: hypothetical protein [Bacillus]MEC3434611.1 hypothetical protein [Bacillus cereus]AFQ30401.1 hypothetical protein BTF1_31507 [Bacillus thuringiensis HD-789]AJH02563.1 hypothetical protein AS86_6666 [Bacillus thuringiensis HD1002]AND28590.1 hypothetical protein ATN07_33310 [Bacillus thuringiensis serovar israelensis]EEM99432.1 hypothetical protein bthur0014_59380 [Bacillus thuringiensis IBL 4222]
MGEKETLDKLKENIYHLDRSMDDAPYHGFNGDHIKGVRFAVNKILADTGLTTVSIFKEISKKG